MLSYAGWGGRISGKTPRNIPTQTKLPKGDTDPIMTDQRKTQGRQQGNQQEQFDKDERGVEGAKRYNFRTRARLQRNQIIGQSKIGIRWAGGHPTLTIGPSDSYNRWAPMGFWRNPPETQEQGKQKGRRSAGWASSQTHTHQTRSGGGALR